MNLKEIHAKGLGSALGSAWFHSSLKIRLYGISMQRALDPDLDPWIRTWIQLVPLGLKIVLLQDCHAKGLASSLGSKWFRLVLEISFCKCESLRVQPWFPLVRCSGACNS